MDREQIKELSDYYGSPDLKKDYQDDEAGLLPSDLPRGVLSEDGIYNVLERFTELEKETKHHYDRNARMREKHLRGSFSEISVQELCRYRPFDSICRGNETAGYSG